LQQVLTGQFEQPGGKPLTGLAERLRSNLADTPGRELKSAVAPVVSLNLT
jgi:hypothetical protein